MKRLLSDIKYYPTAIIGMIMIFIILFVAVYAVISIPYDDAVRLWMGNEADVYRNPELVPPVWINWFRKSKLPESFYSVITEEGNPEVEVIDNSEDGILDKTYTYKFDYQYDEFLQDMMLYFTASYSEKMPYVEAVWYAPDGTDYRVTNLSIKSKQTYRFSQDDKLKRRLGESPEIALMATPESIDAGAPEVMKGQYTLELRIRAFEENTTVSTEFVAHGKVFGIAGTDHMRRDIKTALLWGAPIALLFGLLAALCTSLLTMIIAAAGAWVGGWVDNTIQRVTEVNMMLPFLPILVMIGTFYSRNLMTILGATILLSIFSASIKTYRATFLQVKNSSYIEAAKIYGASNSRIVFYYMIPKVVPMLIPGLVLSIPTYVFLEATLAVLGLGDPKLPTWGKLISDAYYNGGLWNHHFYWILEPAVLLIITGFAFAMVGFALDRIFNPRLRDQ